MTTTTFVTVKLEDTPGTLGKAANALADGNVNIDAFAVDGKGNARFLTNNPSGATDALKDAGFSPKTADVIQVNLPNEPGQLGRLGTELGKKGVNIESCFGATGGGGTGTVFLRVSDIEKATPIVEKIGGRATTTPGTN